MPVNLLHDHLGGFDSEYICKELMEAETGEVQVEYLLSNEIKKRHPHLDIQFSAFLMVRNNHYEKFLNLPEPITEKRTNFLCSFNRSKHISRTNFITRLFFNNWFDPKFCSKGFTITPDELYNITKDFKGKDKFDASWEDTFQFIQTEYHQGSSTHTISNGQIDRDLEVLSPLITKSFITVVSETVASSYVPFPTEKICFPIANKSLWLAYGQPGYYKFLETYMGLQPFVGIDYSFDTITDPLQRLNAVIEEIKRLQSLPEDQKDDLYSLNQHVINHNFIVLTNGDMIAKIWEFDQCLDHYAEIARMSKIGGYVQSDIGTNIIKQFALLRQRQLEKEQRFKHFG